MFGRGEEGVLGVEGCIGWRCSRCPWAPEGVGSLHWSRAVLIEGCCCCGCCCAVGVVQNCSEVLGTVECCGVVVIITRLQTR